MYSLSTVFFSYSLCNFLIGTIPFGSSNNKNNIKNKNKIIKIQIFYARGQKCNRRYLRVGCGNTTRTSVIDKDKDVEQIKTLY